MVEYVIHNLLTFERKIINHQNYCLSNVKTFKGHSVTLLYGSSVGILGFGFIGKNFKNLLQNILLFKK